jgi:hypothetical protein
MDRRWCKTRSYENLRKLLEAYAQIPDFSRGLHQIRSPACAQPALY